MEAWRQDLLERTIRAPRSRVEIRTLETPPAFAADSPGGCYRTPYSWVKALHAFLERHPRLLEAVNEEEREEHRREADALAERLPLAVVQIGEDAGDGTQGGDEALYQEANTAWSAVGQGGTHSANANPFSASFGTSTGANTAFGESLGVANSTGGLEATNAIPQMAFSIEKVTATAVTRALKAEYSVEIAQDLKAIHNLDAESELANILSAEILAEVNREVVRSIGYAAANGAAQTATAGTFDLDVDSNGRWSVEKFKGLFFQIEREANAIAKQTRRGRGNIIITSSDVASALVAAGVLDYTPAMQADLAVDDTGNTFAGTLMGRYKVFVDPYAPIGAAAEYFVVGYKGSSPYDAGLFYCPYVPLQMYRAVDPNSFVPKIGFKTRYALVSNPFSKGTAGQSNGSIEADVNQYYRKVKVSNLF